MGKEKVVVQIEGGKATAAPPLGPALGPLKVNIGQIVQEINTKTKDLAGMQVPVTVTVDTDTKEYEITVGTPPASALIKKEAGVKKGAANPLKEKVADLKIEQIIKIAKMKSDSLLGKDMKQKCKEIMGTCQAMGIMVEGMDSRDALKEVMNGKYDKEILSGKTELSSDDIKELAEEKKHLQDELEAKRSEYEAKAKEISAALEGKDRSVIKAKMIEAELPLQFIEHFLPKEEKKK